MDKTRWDVLSQEEQDEYLKAFVGAILQGQDEYREISRRLRQEQIIPAEEMMRQITV